MKQFYRFNKEFDVQGWFMLCFGKNIPHLYA